MADLAQTAANVKLMSSTTVSVGVAGETVTQGQPVYTAASKWYRCLATDSAKDACAGIVLTPAATDGYFVYAPPGANVDLGATLTVGETYVLSAVGAIAPIGDLTTGDYVTTIGTAITVANLYFDPIVSGVQVP